MEVSYSERDSQRYRSAELALTRRWLLKHQFVGRVVPADLKKNAGNYTSVTHWEALKCAAFNPKAGRLIGVVGIYQPDGYSDPPLCHGSEEFVRFFINWGGEEGFQAVNLSHFTVCDAPQGSDTSRYPIYKLLSTPFDKDRYRECVREGIQPKVRAVLSWQQVPLKTASFVPMFGNVIESRIHIESIIELMGLFENERMQREPVAQAHVMRLV